MIDFLQVAIRHLVTHRVGNKLNNEGYSLSKEESTLEEETQQYLLSYFLEGVNYNEVYNFSHPVDIELNEVYRMARGLFEEPDSFMEVSQGIAKLLYEQSQHPKIKEGELSVVYFGNVVAAEGPVDAIGIFKSETNVPYLKMTNRKSGYNISHDFGYELKGIDKGCIILNTDAEHGYELLVIDPNRTADAHYWKDAFLKIAPRSNGYYQTNEFLSLTKQFVTKQLEQEYEVENTHKIEYLNRSVDFFKTNEQFSEGAFLERVFGDKDVINSFRQYKGEYADDNGVELREEFDISAPAVKRQSRIFKSVLKLDKNFHVYVHGNTELIEKGYDEQMGKHFYKIYFDEES